MSAKSPTIRITTQHSRLFSNQPEPEILTNGTACRIRRAFLLTHADDLVARHAKFDNLPLIVQILAKLGRLSEVNSERCVGTFEQ